MSKKGSKKCLSLRGWASNIRIFKDAPTDLSLSNIFLNHISHMDLADRATRKSDKSYVSSNDDEFLADESHRTCNNDSTDNFFESESQNSLLGDDQPGNEPAQFRESKSCSPIATKSAIVVDPNKEIESRSQEVSKGGRSASEASPRKPAKQEQKGSRRVHRKAITLTNSFRVRQSLTRSSMKQKSAEAVKFQCLFEDWMQKE